MVVCHSYRPNFFMRKIARLCEKYLDRYKGFSYDFVEGGEQNVLERLSALKFKTIFDVGANVGGWSVIATRYFPDATIHTFELAQQTYGNLLGILRDPSFKNNNIGLSNIDGFIKYKDYGTNSELNTLLVNSDFHDRRMQPKIVEAKVMTGDSYCAANNIDHVDFLKIDVEGAEHLVLEGFDRFLNAGRVRCIQFEYGYTHGDVKFLMRDFYELFKGMDYIIAKVRKKIIRFDDFNYQLNDFTSGPNYIAIRRDDDEVFNVLTK